MLFDRRSGVIPLTFDTPKEVTPALTGQLLMGLASVLIYPARNELEPSDPLGASTRAEPSPLDRPLTRSLRRSQEVIYAYFLRLVKFCTPEEATQKFHRTLIQHVVTEDNDVFRAVEELLFTNHIEEFKFTLTRCCYILINNWLASNNADAIAGLVQVFDDPLIHRPTLSLGLNRLRAYLRDFLTSSQYQNLKLYAARYTDIQQKHWTHRYTPYLLASQYTDPRNSLEERRIAKELADAWKARFRQELTHFSARAGSPRAQDSYNPTALGPEALDLIKQVIAPHSLFGYRNLASLFLKQTRGFNLRAYKLSLHPYLVSAHPLNQMTQPVPTGLSAQLLRYLEQLYPDYGERPVDAALQLRTGKQLLEALTADRKGEPSLLFLQFVSEGASLALIFILLKLLLICPQARAHLEAHIAYLVNHYRHLQERDCRWLIHFLEAFQIASVIHTDDKIQFNLVEVSQPSPLGMTARERIFAQTECPMTDEEMRKLSLPRRLGRQPSPQPAVLGRGTSA